MNHKKPKAQRTDIYAPKKEDGLKQLAEAHAKRCGNLRVNKDARLRAAERKLLNP